MNTDNLITILTHITVFLLGCSFAFAIVKSKIVEIALDGLTTDGSHHKQWFLEEILKVFGYDTYKKIFERLNKDITKKEFDKGEYYDYDEGIAP